MTFFKTEPLQSLAHPYNSFSYIKSATTVTNDFHKSSLSPSGLGEKIFAALVELAVVVVEAVVVVVVLELIEGWGTLF